MGLSNTKILYLTAHLLMVHGATDETNGGHSRDLSNGSKSDLSSNGLTAESLSEKPDIVVQWKDAGGLEGSKVRDEPLDVAYNCHVEFDEQFKAIRESFFKRFHGEMQQHFDSEGELQTHLLNPDSWGPRENIRFSAGSGSCLNFTNDDLFAIKDLTEADWNQLSRQEYRDAYTKHMCGCMDDSVNPGLVCILMVLSDRNGKHFVVMNNLFKTKLQDVADKYEWVETTDNFDLKGADNSRFQGAQFLQRGWLCGELKDTDFRVLIGNKGDSITLKTNEFNADLIRYEIGGIYNGLNFLPRVNGVDFSYVLQSVAVPPGTELDEEYLAKCGVVVGYTTPLPNHDGRMLIMFKSFVDILQPHNDVTIAGYQQKIKQGMESGKCDPKQLLLRWKAFVNTHLKIEDSQGSSRGCLSHYGLGMSDISFRRHPKPFLKKYNRVFRQKLKYDPRCFLDGAWNDVARRSKLRVIKFADAEPFTPFIREEWFHHKKTGSLQKQTYREHKPLASK